MSMTVEDLGGGNFSVRQNLVRPVVYLDHWAVRMFSEADNLQARFLAALQGHRGTLLFSQVNFSEFAAMTDLAQAEAVERFLDASLPNLYVADMAADAGFTFPNGAKGENELHWLFREVAELCVKNGGKLTTKSLVTDVIKYREKLQPIFDDMKEGIATAVNSLGTRDDMIKKAKNFKPDMAMSPHDALTGELLRTFVLDAVSEFSANDAVDLVHAAPALVVADFVLLDGKWADKVARSSARLQDAGVTFPIALCFSKRDDGISAFLRALEGYAGPVGEPAG